MTYITLQDELTPTLDMSIVGYWTMFRVEYLNAILDVNASLLVLTVLLRSVNVWYLVTLSRPILISSHYMELPALFITYHIINVCMQKPMRVRLQVFKTERRGWGIRALNDIPAGGFICIYVGNLYSNDEANR